MRSTVLSYVAQQAVAYRWLKPGEMLDGLGMAETTPAPLIMVTQFVGFMGAYRAPGASILCLPAHYCPTYHFIFSPIFPPKA
ncbi:hypothetical protein QO004_003720 [Rhizobium mesoamericanum]|nr:hypothetical protein [Rhizobium mesoamericanum]